MTQDITESRRPEAVSKAKTLKTVTDIIENAASATEVIVNRMGDEMEDAERSRWALVLIQLRTAHNHARAMSELAGMRAQRSDET